MNFQSVSAAQRQSIKFALWNAECRYRDRERVVVENYKFRVRTLYGRVHLRWMWYIHYRHLLVPSSV